MSPTQRSLALLRERGFVAQVVERWNPYARKRIDLFGCWDICAVGNGEFVLVQCTSGSNVSSRVGKVADSSITPELRKAGVRLFVHGWRKLKTGWAAREVDLS